MNYIGMKVKVPSGNIGIIKSHQEKNGIFHEGFFVKFDDCPVTLFMVKDVCEIQYDENNLDTENKQIQFKL